MTFLISQQAFANLPPVAWVDRDGQEHTMPTTDFNWKHVRVYRRFCYILTGSWSVFLLGEFIAKVIMIKSTLDVERIVLYGNIILICVFVISINMTLIGSYFVRKRTRAVTGDWLKIHDYRVDQRRNGHFRHDI
ncbi:hypothetical protein G6F56_012225 [Rhizopus delemar]|nr:hypothetical protein G6F56_012225 [Rhizopus delemar]